MRIGMVFLISFWLFGAIMWYDVADKSKSLWITLLSLCLCYFLIWFSLMTLLEKI